jgi:uncharacterized protein (DUF3820 family)
MTHEMVHVVAESSNVPMRPSDAISRGAEQARPLAEMIKSQKLSVKISGREYVKAEGWTTLAAMNGVLAREEEVIKLDDGTYIATVALVRINDGAVLTRASAECGMDEPMWAQRPNYARRSMAITRATGKACRIAFSWIMSLAGYEVTPAEEMDSVAHEVRPPAQQPRPVDEVVHATVVDEGVPYRPVIPFGKNKGKALAELAPQSLNWYLERIQQTLAEKGKLSQIDQNLKEDIELELAGRAKKASDVHAKQMSSEEIPF